MYHPWGTPDITHQLPYNGKFKNDIRVHCDSDS